MVGVQRKKFKEEPGFSARVKESQKWTSLVRECGQQLGYKPDSFVYDYMTSLILVESSGNSKAVSGVGARGLCQLLFSTAQDAYAQIKPKERQLLNIPKKEITPDNLFDPKTNIALCMQYLADRARFYTDPSLAFWVYHLGDGNLIHAMTAYLGNVPYTGDPKGTVERYKLNFVKLITNNAVIARLNRDGAFNDDTQFYVPRIAAAKTFLG